MGKLVFIGCGLGDDRALSLAALDALRKADEVYAEFYTSRPVGCTIDQWVREVGRRTAKTIRLLSRHEVESGMGTVVERARGRSVAFCTAGDALAATTHQVLRVEAVRAGIAVEVVPGSSVVTAVPALAGLSDYKFGRTTTIAFPERNYFPTSPYEVVAANLERGLHTLVLLDIRADDPALPPRFLTAGEGVTLLLEMAARLAREGRPTPFREDSAVVVVARAGAPDVHVAAGLARYMAGRDFGPPLHALVVPGTLSDAERDALEALTGFHAP